MKEDAQMLEILERIRNGESVPKEDVISALKSYGYSSNCDTVAAHYFDCVAPILHYHPEWITELLQFVLEPLYVNGVDNAEHLEWWVREYYLAECSLNRNLGEDGRRFLDKELFGRGDELEDAFGRVRAWYVVSYNDPDSTDSFTPAEIYRLVSSRRSDLFGSISEAAFARGLNVLRAQGVFTREPNEYWSWEKLMAAVEEAARDAGDE